MILIADSGSTKTDWLLIDRSGKRMAIETDGINPYLRSPGDISEELREKLLPIVGDELDAVFFYGAGIIDATKGETIKEALLQVFNVPYIETYSDILGAARALFKKEAGIVCILGTGSNASFYDGNTIADRIPSLGYILGDEGSGAVLGKYLISAYMKRQLPGFLRKKLEAHFKIEEPDILEKVYKKEKPNQFLATFTIFLKEYLSEPYCHDLIYKSFVDFFEYNIQVLKTNGTKNLGVVGSVGYVFQDIFSEVALTFGFDRVAFTRKPLDLLADFHQTNH